MMNTSASAVPPPSLEATVNSIASHLVHGGALTRGDGAALRRMDPQRPDAAFFKIEGLVLDDQLPGDADARTELETRWAAIIIGLAHLGTLHQPGHRLGIALGKSDYSELRFARLIRADAERLIDDLPSLARYLTAKGVPVDWADAARLMLSAGRRDEEPVRRHLARDYYGLLARNDNA